MNRKISRIIFFLSFVLASIAMIGAESGINIFKTITKKGKMSEITFAYAKRQNYTMRDGKNEFHPDGIVFYFVIYGLNKDAKTPAFVELRDFSVNGISYLEMTRRDNIADVEPNTIIYDEETFQNDEFYEKVNIKKNVGVLIEKVTICGTNIPENGLINVDLKVGFDNKVEGFNYQFNIGDIEK